MLEARSLSKEFDGHPALTGLDLKVESGEVFCLLGANGAGKTTTIHLFLGFLTPTSGQALVAGTEVASDALAARRRLAYIPEQVQLYPSLTGLENLGYLTALGGRDDLSDAELRGFLERAGLQTEAASRRMSTYSKGMRQKVAIAVALAKGAEALLLDEPTSGLDPKATNELSNLLRELSQEGVAVLMATHDLFRAKEIGHRLGIMKQGRLLDVLDASAVDHGQLEQIYLDHMHD
ncbi:MAG: ATP-binding cassette domain-containing protein [Acidobacteriota bacterium]